MGVAKDRRAETAAVLAAVGRLRHLHLRAVRTGGSSHTHGHGHVKITLFDAEPTPTSCPRKLGVLQLQPERADRVIATATRDARACGVPVTRDGGYLTASERAAAAGVIPRTPEAVR